MGRRRLESGLPPPPAAGYTMTALRDAARALGLNLIGVRLPKGDHRLDRPALVFLRRGPHGHFAVVRPVGLSGRLLQVLDPNREPEVVDAADLMAMPEWTGLALIPERPARAVRVAGALAGGLAVLFGLIIVVPSLHRRRRAAR